MTYSKSWKSCAFLFVLFFPAMIFLLFSTPLQAANSQDNQSGFSFKKPKIFFGGHAGMNFPQAKGDIFGTAIRDLTLKKSDFRSPAFGFDFGFYIRSHFAAVASLDYGSPLWLDDYMVFVPGLYPVFSGASSGGFSSGGASSGKDHTPAHGQMTDHGYVQITPIDSGRHATPRNGDHSPSSPSPGTHIVTAPIYFGSSGSSAPASKGNSVPATTGSSAPALSGSSAPASSSGSSSSSGSNAPPASGNEDSGRRAVPR